MKMLLAHDLIHDDCMTITGKTVGQLLKRVPVKPRKDQDVIRPWDNPMYRHGHLAILRGNLSAGYERGESVMDQNLLLTSGNNASPPFMFEGPHPTWILTTSGQRLGSIQ